MKRTATLCAGLLILTIAGVPVAAAESELSGCTEVSGTSSSSGTNYLKTGGTSFAAGGSWTNGCGGKGSDDNVSGNTNILGTIYKFDVVEMHPTAILNDFSTKKVRCTLQDTETGSLVSAEQGDVSPAQSSNAVLTVTFACSDDDGEIFNGALTGRQTEEVAELFTHE